MTYYRTTKNLAYRTGPGTKYSKMGVLAKGALILVVGHTGKWLKIKKSNKYYFCSGTYAKKAVNYGALVANHIPVVALDVVKNKADHVSGSYRYKGPKVNCSVFVSAILQDLGLLTEEKTLSHTSVNHKKNTLGDCVHNRLKVEHYSWNKTSKLFAALPDSYKKPGSIYIYPSSVGILGQDGYIYGCHSTGKKYTKLTMVKHTSKKDYEYTHLILAVGVPEIE